MKIASMGFNINFHRKAYRNNNCEHSIVSNPCTDTYNSYTQKVLQAEDLETKKRYLELKNGHFSRRLTSDEALILASPYSIEYIDYCDTKINEPIPLDNAIAQRNARKIFNNLRRLDASEIECFIGFIDESDGFDSSNQIIRFLLLTNPEQKEFNRSLSFAEGVYFAKKCSTKNEIEDFIKHIEDNPEIKKIYLPNKDNCISISYRTRQIDGKKEFKFDIRKENICAHFVFVEGKLKSISKSYIQENEVLNYDSIQRTTGICRYVIKPYGDEQTDCLIETIEILNNENGEMDRIQKTTVNTTDYIANTEIYYLKDYPEELDLLGLIKESKVQSSTQSTRKITNPDGSTTTEENFQSKNIQLKKKSTKFKKGYLLEIEVKDNNKNVLYCSSRGFRKINADETLTIIDGKNYLTKFNNKTKTATITFDDGNTKTIDNIISPYVVPMTKEEKQALQKLWNFIKTSVPADFLLLLNLNQTYLLPCENEIESGFSNNIYSAIHTGFNTGILAHEIGHMVSAYNRLEDKKLHLNKELQRIYIEELQNYEKEHSSWIIQSTLEYFTQTGGSKDRREELQSIKAKTNEEKEELKDSNGLSELIAETMYIKSSPNAQNLLISARTHLLMKYFPKTIAYISKLLDENFRLSLLAKNNL